MTPKSNATELKTFDFSKVIILWLIWKGRAENACLRPYSSSQNSTNWNSESACCTNSKSHFLRPHPVTGSMRKYTLPMARDAFETCSWFIKLTWQGDGECWTFICGAFSFSVLIGWQLKLCPISDQIFLYHFYMYCCQWFKRVGLNSQNNVDNALLCCNKAGHLYLTKKRLKREFKLNFNFINIIYASQKPLSPILEEFFTTRRIVLQFDCV